LVYFMYTANLPTSPTTTTATFADNTAILATDSDPAVAPQKLQTHLLAIQINTSGYTQIGNLLGNITSSPNRNISQLLSPRCTGCLDENHSSP
jgi:hypothetical protein